MLSRRLQVCVGPGGPSGGHGGDDLDDLAVVSVDGALDGLFHLHLGLQGWGQLSSLRHVKEKRDEVLNIRLLRSMMPKLTSRDGFKFLIFPHWS